MPIGHSPHKHKEDTVSNRCLMDLIKASNEDLKSCFRNLDAKVDNAVLLISKLEKTCRGLDERLQSMENNVECLEDRITSLKDDHCSTKVKLDGLTYNVMQISKQNYT